MQVFVTGASGHIASAVIPELLGAGHEVVGLARSDVSAAAVQALGAKVHRGGLDDLDTLREAAAASDGVIHLAFKHEQVASEDFGAAMDAHMDTIEALGGALAGTGKPMVATSATLMLVFSGVSGTATESDAVTAGLGAEAEKAVLALAERGVRSSIVRLPPTVHSSLDHRGYIPALIGIARETGRAGYVGEGSNRWPAVHTLDAGRVYRLTIEAAPAGSRLHAVADGGPVPRDRRDHRPPPGRAGCKHLTRGCSRLLRPPLLSRLGRQPDVERAHSAPARLALGTHWAHRRSQPRSLLPDGVKMKKIQYNTYGPPVPSGQTSA